MHRHLTAILKYCTFSQNLLHLIHCFFKFFIELYHNIYNIYISLKYFFKFYYFNKIMTKLSDIRMWESKGFSHDVSFVGVLPWVHCCCLQWETSYIGASISYWPCHSLVAQMPVKLLTRLQFQLQSATIDKAEIHIDEQTTVIKKNFDWISYGKIFLYSRRGHRKILLLKWIKVFLLYFFLISTNGHSLSTCHWTVWEWQTYYLPTYNSSIIESDLLSFDIFI